jgi:hypothetical protein
MAYTVSLISALERGERSASRPGRVLLLGKGFPVQYSTGGWVGPTACLDASVWDRTAVVQALVSILTATRFPSIYTCMYKICLFNILLLN